MNVLSDEEIKDLENEEMFDAYNHIYGTDDAIFQDIRGEVFNIVTDENSYNLVRFLHSVIAELRKDFSCLK